MSDVVIGSSGETIPGFNPTVVSPIAPGGPVRTVAATRPKPKPKPKPKANPGAGLLAEEKGISFQRPFDKRTLSTPLAKGNPLQRGFMIQADKNIKGGSRFGLRFLFNPESVSTDYSINADVYAPYEQPVQGFASPVGAVPGSATVSFGLLFDRTYDCWGPAIKGDLASSLGVRHDIAQFENMVGYSEASPFMSIVAMKVFFGHSANFALQYYGYVTGFQVVYTTWNQDMRPVRCGLNISMSVLPAEFNTQSVPTAAAPAPGTPGVAVTPSGGGTPTAPSTQWNGRPPPHGGKVPV